MEAPINLKNSSTNPKQKKIVIVGGRQCIGLAAGLQHSRLKNKFNDQYAITSFIKPDAPTEEILKVCKIYEFNDDDKVILCVGQHDTNPTKMLIELSSTLKSLDRYSTLVLEPSDSDFFREEKLKYELNLICEKFPNCKFIQTRSNEENKFHHDLTNQLYKRLNSEINQIDYNKKFLYPGGLKNLLNARNRVGGNNWQKTKEYNTTKNKNKITYYFSSFRIRERSFSQMQERNNPLLFSPFRQNHIA